MCRALLSILLGVAPCVHAQSFQTSVQPLPAEDLAHQCRYELTLPKDEPLIRGLVIIYDRGPEITAFYSDSDVATFAKKHHLGLLLASQCDGNNAPGGPAEMDMDPFHGVGRALLTAIDQFARQSHRPELSSSRLVLLGFSGTGALFAHFEEYAPKRVAAAVLVHPAHYEPMGLDRVHLSKEGRDVPELIFAGGADKIATTQVPYDYFLRFYQQGAPWTFVVQDGAGHFAGVDTAKPLILAWLDEVLKERSPDPYQPLHKISEAGTWSGYISKCSLDEHAASIWNVCTAAIAKIKSSAPKNMLPAGWLPSKQTARLWLQTEQRLGTSSNP